jgi:hypothetical protein
MSEDRIIRPNRDICECAAEKVSGLFPFRAVRDKNQAAGKKLRELKGVVCAVEVLPVFTYVVERCELGKSSDMRMRNLKKETYRKRNQMLTEINFTLWVSRMP